TFQRPEKFPHIVFRDWGLGIRNWRTTSLESSAPARPKNFGSMAKHTGKQSQATSHYLQVGSWSSQRTGELLTQSKNDWNSLMAKLTPKPQRIFVRNGQVTLDKNVTIVLPNGATEFERTAAELMVDTLQGLGFRRARLLPSHDCRFPTIVLSTLDKLPANLRPNLPIAKLRKFFAQRGEEAYAIFVGTGDEGRGTREKTPLRTLHSAPCTVVVGSSPRGVFNGVQTLRQLLFSADAQSQISSPKSPVPDAITLPACEIWDYPDLKLRGWHFIAPLKHELPFAEKLLDWFALMKFNTLVIEVDDRFPYERHPEIAHSQALTKTQWQQFLAKARRLGFEIVPQVQTFGHFGYVLNKPKYRHLSELKEPHPRWGFFAYCPSEPETYKVVFDLFDEVLEVFKPRWFHIGHDEITFVPIGVCDRCRGTGKTAWQLLAEDIRKLYDYLKAKGIERVAMWCDQLEPDRTGGYPPYFTHFASDLIPKNIVQFCWHYDARQTFPWLTRLKDKGFDVVACGWYHAQNVWRFAAESFDRRAMGYCGTTWYGVTGFATQVDLMAAVILGAQNSWSVDNPQIEFAQHPTNIAQDLWAIVGERTRWKEGLTEFICVDLSPFVNASLTRWGSEGLVPDKCAELERAGSEIWCDGVPFRLVKVPNAPPQVVALSSDSTSHEVAPDLVAVPIKAKAEAIYLLLTTTARPIRTEDMYQRGRTDPRKVATLVVRYGDGSEEQVELLYRRHLTEWNDRIGCSHARIVWQGKTERGYLLNLCAYKWLNPKPNVPVAEVTIVSSASLVQPVLVALTVCSLSKKTGDYEDERFIKADT
ncbi:MAG: family 20 glycosylhydrolase, partial [Armatimonadota bacterium]|nr:family 20 glycosylhydrolase [Armatimonadota bacterium]